MKKFTALLTAFAIVFLLGLSVSATADYNVPDRVSLEEGAASGSVSFTVSNTSAFAGGEFAIVCGAGVTVTSVSYGVSASNTVPPFLNNDGKTVFSFFSTTNDYSGNITVTMNFTCGGTGNSSVRIENVKFITVNGGVPSSTLTEINKTVIIEHIDTTTSNTSDSDTASADTTETDTTSADSTTSDATSSDTSASDTTAPDTTVSDTTNPQSTTAQPVTNAPTTNSNDTPRNGSNNGITAVVCIVSALVVAAITVCVIVYTVRRRRK